MKLMRNSGSGAGRLLGDDVTRRVVLGGLAAGSLGTLLPSAGFPRAAAQEATPGIAPGPPILEWLGTLDARIGAPIMLGDTARGSRLIAPMVDGTLEGPGISGRITSPSADWMLVRSDGVGEIDVRVMIQTDDDALLYISYRGYLTNIPELLPRWAQGEEIDPSEYYFATTLVFETAAPQYAWLQQTVVVGQGTLTIGGVRYELFAVS